MACYTPSARSKNNMNKLIQQLSEVFQSSAKLAAKGSSQAEGLGFLARHLSHLDDTSICQLAAGALSPSTAVLTLAGSPAEREMARRFQTAA